MLQRDTHDPGLSATVGSVGAQAAPTLDIQYFGVDGQIAGKDGELQPVRVFGRDLGSGLDW